MDANSTLILTAVASGLAGMAAGAFLMFRGMRPQSRQQLEARLQESEQKLKQQNAQMTEHFTHTASLVSNLTRNYCDLNDYLASSAQQLGNVDIQPVLAGNGKSASILGRGVVITPPLDYAPKNNEIGTLSETYGLKEEEQAKPKNDAYAD